MKCFEPSLQVDLHGQDVQYNVTCAQAESGVSVYTLTLDFPLSTVPKPIDVGFALEKVDIYSAFVPNVNRPCTVTADWSPLKNHSRLASGAPVLALIGRADNNRCTVALSDCKTPTCLSVGVHEEDCTVVLKAEFFTEAVAPLKNYIAEIRIDCRDIKAARSLKDVRAWWTQCGYSPALVPQAATYPMYSTWYSMHQNVSTDGILEQCRIAKTLGMDTVIIDDGWQTDDSNRGYAYCGDWKVCADKIPDFGALVEKLHKIGMKVMLWLSVPFVGKYSDAYGRFTGKYLYVDDSAGAGVLDPRFAEVRAYLVGIYVDFARRFGVDGFKLDFIDNFCVRADLSRAVGGDCASLEDGIAKLLAEIEAGLKAVKPDVMIEFRQTYIGGVMQSYGNMLRVGDCPGNATLNKYGTIGLRLLSSGVAVHADPIVWHASERVEFAAMQLSHTLFSVPQVSVDLIKLPQAHKQMLTYYLSYERDNKQTLLFGDLDADGFADGFRVVTATGRDKKISVLFDGALAVDAGKFDVVNATASETIVLKSPRALDCTAAVVDCMGNAVRKEKVALSAGYTEFIVPRSGFAFFDAVAV